MRCASSTASIIRKRTLHGALLDSEILADVYLELIGGRQVALALSAEAEASRASEAGQPKKVARVRPAPLPPRIDATAASAHEDLVESLGEGAIWAKYQT